jgi:hypothetical protein
MISWNSIRFLRMAAWGVVSALVVWTSTAGPARAADVSIEPDPNWTKRQKAEFYIGYLVVAGRGCGLYSQSAEARKIAKLSPYGREGIHRANFADTFTGCHFATKFLNQILDNKDAWIAALRSDYSGSSSIDDPPPSKSPDETHYCKISRTDAVYTTSRSCYRGDEELSKSEFDAHGKKAAGENQASTDGGSSSDLSTGTVEERLLKLKRLVEKGLISPAEATAKRKEILKSL